MCISCRQFFTVEATWVYTRIRTGEVKEPSVTQLNFDCKLMSDVPHDSTSQGHHQTFVYTKKCIENNSPNFVGKTEIHFLS